MSEPRPPTDAEDGALVAFASGLSAGVPVDPTQWPKGFCFDPVFLLVMEYRAWVRECTYRERRAALGLRTQPARRFIDFKAASDRSAAWHAKYGRD